MKVIHCLNHFLPDQIAGTEMYVYNLITHLQESGVEGIALIPNYGKAITEEYITGNVRVIRYAEPSVTDRALMMGKRDPDGLPYFLEVLHAEQPAIVHFHELAGSNGITYRHVAESKAAGFKNIMTFHLSGYSCRTGNLMYKDEVRCDGVIRIGKCAECYLTQRNGRSASAKILNPLSMVLYNAGIDPTAWNSRIGTALGFPFIIKKLRTDLLQLTKDCDAFISLTEWYRKILVKNNVPQNLITHIPQGLTEQIIPSGETVHKGDVLRMIFVGRISSFKGIDLLIEALQAIDPEKITLDIYGPDPEDEYSNQLKQLTSAMSNINWKGILEPGTVSNTISDYDVFCLPSAFSEMSPLVIQESFAAKVPVLASDVYGNAEQITDNKNGWLFAFKNAENLRTKIEMLIDDPALIRAAKNSIKPVRSFSDVANEQLNLYRKILNQA